MNTKTIFYSVILTGLLLSFFINCSKETPKVTPPVTTSTVPTLTTSSITSVISTSFNTGGNIISDGGVAVTARGVCWSTTDSPTTSNSKTTDGTGIGSFTSSITGLTAGTTYFVRAYATNSAGTGYGSQIAVTTSVNPQLPTITTIEVTSISTLTASSGGNITATGSGVVTARGVCWSTSESPTTSNSKTNDGTGTGSFTSSITGLAAGTTYYIRAYATNDSGTAYGNQITFITNVSIQIPTVTTTSISSLASTFATGGGNVTNAGGSTVTSRGVCWSTLNNPTIANFKTIDGLGIGSFSSPITGLSSGITYYVRAYATNSFGTAYGSQVSFVTLLMDQTLKVQTYTVSSITSTTAMTGGSVQLDGAGNVSARGVCWSTTPNPTINDNKTNDGQGAGSFTSYFTGLSPNTKYYYRTYATNNIGTVYGVESTFTTTSPIPTITDQDGNTYPIVTIGTQVWMASNLMTTKFKDATIIPNVTSNTLWSNLVSPGYCWFNNDEAKYKNPYGALYNWYAVNTGKLCPTGWHIPSDIEWTTLTTFLGGTSVAGGKLKEEGISHWSGPNAFGTNVTGFTALPGSFRYNNGSFGSIGGGGSWWSSTLYSVPSYAWYRSMSNSFGFVSRNFDDIEDGLSVRCLKD